MAGNDRTVDAGSCPTGAMASTLILIHRKNTLVDGRSGGIRFAAPDGRMTGKSNFTVGTCRGNPNRGQRAQTVKR